MKDNNDIPSYSKQFITKDVHQKLQHLVSPHVDSFNYFIEYGLDEAIYNLIPMEIELAPELHLKLRYVSAKIDYPSYKDEMGKEISITPSEARESGNTYAGSVTANIEVIINDNVENPMTFSVKAGDVPLMVMCDRCHLKGKSSKKLINMREEANEVGGYFILNGIERVIRLLQVPRRNHATAVIRNSYKNRGTSYSDKGIAMRCCRKDNTSVSLTMHYLNNGGATLRFVLRKQEYLLPVVLVAKCLMDISDMELFEGVLAGDVNNTFLTTRLELLLRDFKNYRCSTKQQCLSFIGSLFRSSLPITERISDEEAGILLIKMYLFVHCDAFADKLECMIHILRKLFSFVQGNCSADNPDALLNHDILLPGHLYTMIVKEKLDEVFYALRQVLKRDYKVNATKCRSVVMNAKLLQTKIENISRTVGQKLGTFLSTGNLVSSSGLDLQQATGFTIVAERLNLLRYMSHFQSVHRGQFFTTMKTTTVRKLLPESWGFLCPVHTPDGSPCGLLNHLARNACILGYESSQKPCFTPNGPLDYINGLDFRVLNRRTYIQDVLVYCGALLAGVGSGDGQLVLDQEYMSLLLDGVYIGGILLDKAKSLVTQLRYFKAASTNLSESNQSNKRSIDILIKNKLLLDPTMEIAYIPCSTHEDGGAYPGIYLFTQSGRMIRPVLQLGTNFIEWISPMEQAWMEIACLKSDIRIGETTHIELDPGVMLSQIAAMTPYSDYNQSPRNMYQCQMGKQTMGTPAHALKHRVDNKLYRIQNVQAPLVQTLAQKDYSMDDYPQGCNAVVAVISYTGYDMEDAMIINKASYERGFGHGSVYKTHTYDLDEEERQMTRKEGQIKPSLDFCNINPSVDNFNSGSNNSDFNEAEKYCESLDSDGLPYEGMSVNYGDPLIVMMDTNTGVCKVIYHKDQESAFVDTVRIIGSNSRSKGIKSSLRKVSITLRYRRNPVIGDKFSSRHGQKGTLSVLWPQESMPFSESGMSPDVLINPHAYPSRMTIGMLIESMAGKSGSVHGNPYVIINSIFQDATPFQFHEEEKVVDYVGCQLTASGYNYCGSEPLYNGLTGEVMHVDIFVGVVFYQRLRHMVSDKSQVRSTGPVTPITRQPVKGRKKHGGIRLGEMERDALLSHGAAFCLQDRLMNCSDIHLAHVCGKCGGLLSVFVNSEIFVSLPGSTGKGTNQIHQQCSTCKTAAFVQPVQLPYVFRYLASELAGMGIKMKLTLTE